MVIVLTQRCREGEKQRKCCQYPVLLISLLPILNWLLAIRHDNIGYWHIPHPSASLTLCYSAIKPQTLAP